MREGLGKSLFKGLDLEYLGVGPLGCDQTTYRSASQWVVLPGSDPKYRSVVEPALKATALLFSLVFVVQAFTALQQFRRRDPCQLSRVQTLADIYQGTLERREEGDRDARLRF